MNELDFMKLAEVFADKPLIIYLFIFFFTFVLEDVATASAALLASYGHIMPEMAYITLLCGIGLGDWGIYGLGYCASQFQWAQKILQKKQVTLVRGWLDKREVLAIITARFIPGARLPTYTAMGFFKLSFRKFIITVLIAGVLWTALLFAAVFTIGEVFVDQLEAYRWPVAGFLIILLYLLPKLFEYRAKKGRQND